MTNSQHLSDQAVAAAADGVLTGHARSRANRHLAECAECSEAVRVQREAAWALRTAPPPVLPGDLVERLRTVAPGETDQPLPTPWPDGAAGTYLPVALPAAAIVSPGRSWGPADPQANDESDDAAGPRERHGDTHRRRPLFPTGLFRPGQR